MIPWLIFLGAMCAITFALRHDRVGFRIGWQVTVSYVLFSILIGALNYIQLGKVFL